jgi:hypothetical protein
MRNGACGGKHGLGQSGGRVNLKRMYAHHVNIMKKGGREAALPYWLRTRQDSVVVVSEVEEIE